MPSASRAFTEGAPCPGLNLTGTNSYQFLPSVPVTPALRGDEQSVTTIMGPVLELPGGALPAGSVAVLSMTVVRNLGTAVDAGSLFPFARRQQTAYSIVGTYPAVSGSQAVQAPIVQLQVDPSSVVAGGRSDDDATIIST